MPESIIAKVRAELARRADYVIPIAAIDSLDYIERRLSTVPGAEVGPVRTVLSYLFLSDGPTNLASRRYVQAQPHLLPAEMTMARYFKSRTNGTGRKTYGKAALRAARAARYRCQVCDETDVRVLVLDHAHGRANTDVFLMLCANCHQLKSRLYDWTGKKRAE